MSKSSIGLSEPIYENILHLIMTKQLMPGEKIQETRLAQDFNISRTPVRDAIRKLSNDGLVEIFPNRFAQVQQFTEASITEVGTLRISLDVMAVKLAGLFGSCADYLGLIQVAEECTKAFEAGDGEKRRQLDCEFHLKLAEISRNSLLLKFQRELCLKVQFIMLHYPQTVSDEMGHLRQHYEIAEALMDHDETRATNLIVAHLTSFYGLRDKFPKDFFKPLL